MGCCSRQAASFDQVCSALQRSPLQPRLLFYSSSKDRIHELPCCRNHTRGVFHHPCHQRHDLLYSLETLGLSCTKVLRRCNATHFHRSQRFLNDFVKSDLCVLFLSHETHQTPCPSLVWKLLKPAKLFIYNGISSFGGKKPTITKTPQHSPKTKTQHIFSISFLFIHPFHV